MTRILRFAYAIPFVVLAARGAFAANDDGIGAFLAQSARAWNNGNLDAFMRGYENAPTTLYIGSKTVTHGYAAIRAHYASHYGTSRMGVLSFSDVSKRMLGPDHALVVARWHLALRDAHPSGLFSLVLHRSAAGWHIIEDHTP